MKTFKYPLIAILSVSVVSLIAVAQLTSCGTKNGSTFKFVDYNTSKTMNSIEFAEKLSDAAPAEVTDLQYTGSDYNESKDIIDSYLFDTENMKNKTSYLLSYYKTLNGWIDIHADFTYNILSNHAKTGFGVTLTAPGEVDNVDITLSWTVYSIFSHCALEYYDTDEHDFVTSNYYEYKQFRHDIVKNSSPEEETTEYAQANYAKIIDYYYDIGGDYVELGFGETYGGPNYIGVLVPPTLFPNFTFAVHEYP